VSDQPTTSGSVKMLTRLENVVIVMDRARSPRAIWVSIVDVVPPGQAAISMKPTAISGRIGMIETSVKATIGRAMICMIAPTRKSRGRRTRRVKSGSVSVSPIENMMIASDTGRNTRAMSSVLTNSFLPRLYGGRSRWLQIPLGDGA
jgi:hypothetical protein